MNRRTFLASSVAGWAAASLGSADAPQAGAGMGLLVYSYGLRARAEAKREWTRPEAFLAFAQQRGANAVQLPIGIRSTEDCHTLRRWTEQQGLALEGILTPPKTPADLDRIAAELRTARECGVNVLRIVMLGGRRYEVFQRPEDYPAFAKKAVEALGQIEKLAAQHRVHLAVENHKDYRTEELLELLQRISSPWVGVCLDTGNSISLLEDPLATISALAPHTRTVHLKDIAFEESPEGFRMVEVPLGQGVLDLPTIVQLIRKARPQARFQLEMITRDPLDIPCLKEVYWATLDRVSGRELARTLALVRRHAKPQNPLPRISKLPQEEQLAIEDRNVRQSFEYVQQKRLLG